MKLLALISILALTACASITKGTTQDIEITSNPVGALCKVYNNGQLVGWITTPDWITVDRTKHNLIVKCTKIGYKETSYTNYSGTESRTMGNILVGGVVGWGVDSALGADNKYQPFINVNMSK